MLPRNRSHLTSAKLLLDHGKLEEAVSIAYYSMYHSLTALLFRTGIKCENHVATIALLKKVVNIDNSDISRARRERVDKQSIQISISLKKRGQGADPGRREI